MTGNTQEPKTPENELMTLAEMEDLVEYFIGQTDWDHYTIDGLTFMLHTFAELAEQGSLRAIDDAHALTRFIYKYSMSCNDAQIRFKDTIHSRFRKTDYTQRNPLDDEDENPKEETVLDLSDLKTEEDECIDIAKHISAILKNPATPTHIYNGLSDALGSLDLPKEFVDSPEYVAQILCQEKEGRDE